MENLTEKDLERLMKRAKKNIAKYDNKSYVKVMSFVNDITNGNDVGEMLNSLLNDLEALIKTVLHMGFISSGDGVFIHNREAVVGGIEKLMFSIAQFSAEMCDENTELAMNILKDEIEEMMGK